MHQVLGPIAFTVHLTPCTLYFVSYILILNQQPIMKLRSKFVWERFVLASRCFSSGATAIKIDRIPNSGLIMKS